MPLTLVDQNNGDNIVDNCPLNSLVCVIGRKPLFLTVGYYGKTKIQSLNVVQG